MRYTIFNTPYLTTVFSQIARLTLCLFRFETENRLPKEIKKYVAIAAPHTSNWDVPIMLFIGLAERLPMFWMGKKSLFKFPFGLILRYLGGVAVDRSGKNNTVELMTGFLKAYPGPACLMISPEGTRGRVDEWRTGFHAIAKRAGVPIAFGYIDYRHRCGGLSFMYIQETRTFELDMKEIRGFYRLVAPLYPEKFALHGEWRTSTQ